MKKFNIILFVALLIFLSNVNAVEYVGDYNGRFVILADNYVIKLPSNLITPAQINNQFNMPFVPQILINDQVATVALLIDEELIENPGERLIFEGKTTKQDVEIIETVELKGNFIISRTKLSNKGSESVNIKVDYGFRFEIPITLFSPYLFDNASENYLVFLNKKIIGNGLGVIFSFPLNHPASNLQEKTAWPSGATVEELNAGSSVTFEMKYYPFNAQYSIEKEYSNELSSFMEEPLIKVSGDVGSVDVNISSSTFLTDMLDKISEDKKAGLGTFGGFHDVNVEEGSMDSLGVSIYFKEMCKKVKVPCRLVVGEAGEMKYAWIRAYLNEWKDVDPFAGTDVKPVGYNVKYIEPQIELKILPEFETEEESVYHGTSWLKSVGESSLFLYIIILIIASVGVFIFIQFKAKKMVRYVKTGKMVIREDINGKYGIIKEDVKDLFSQEIIKKIKEKNGEVDVKIIAGEMGYSEELVKSGIKFLSDKGLIKRRGISPRVEKKEITFKNYLPIMFKESKKTFKNMTKKQKYIVIAIIAIAAILVVLLLLF